MRRRGFIAGLGALAVGCVRADTCETSPPVAAPSPAPPAPTPAQPEVPDFSALAGTCEGVPAITVAEYEQRLSTLRSKLAAAGQSALIIEAGVDLQYFGGPHWHLSERPLLLVVPRDGDAILIGPAFEHGTLEARMGPHRYELRTWNEHESPYALVDSYLRETKQRGPIAVGSATRAFILDGLRRAAPKRDFDVGEGVLAACRRIKSPAELALLRRANEATKLAIAAAAPHVREGMAEAELAAIVRSALQASGLIDPWALVLFGPNAAYPHGTPEGRTLHDGDLILVDTGAFLHGYASDITRTWAFPDVSAIDDERRAAWEVVREAQATALATIRPGVRCADVDAAARAVIAKAGFDGGYGHFTHRLGHGIGMQVHEPPYLVRDAEHLLEVGNTMSDEPGIYLPGKWGIRLEDIVAVTEQGAELFGPAPTALQ